MLQSTQKHADEHKFIVSVNKVYKRVASAIGVSRNFKKEMLNLQHRTISSYITLKIRKNQPCTNLDVYNISVVRKTITEFYIHEKKIPTVETVQMEL